ncbi:MAG: DNA repair exonuclease [Planctomycetaceae bacterium]|nr:DNA repair exonuclease [Planctomycetaceae bacterium]
MFKFLHAADIHLDSPLRGLEQYEGAPVQFIRGATRRALENLIQLAIEEEVAFVLIAGDVYDGDWQDYSTGHFFNQQMRKLREQKIPVYLIAGNHDAANKLTKSLPLPENVRLLGHRQPETVLLPDWNVAIHGQSYATQAVSEDLSLKYPAPVPGRFNIGMLHTSATGREGHENYAPCTIEGLKTSGYDYWALGHVHTREILNESPPIIFPGNLQGRHIRETGEKGAMLVTVDQQNNPLVEFRCLDVMRWELCHVNLSGVTEVKDVRSRLSDELANVLDRSAGRPVAARVEWTGESNFHPELMADREHWRQVTRDAANDLAGERLWIEKVRFTTRPPVNEDSLPEEADGPIEVVMEIMKELRFRDSDQEVPKAITNDLTNLTRKLSADLRKQLQVDSETWLNEVLADAEAILTGELTERTGR